MINLIVAIDKNRGIGKDNNLPTHIPQDLRYFKQTSNNHTVVMGYNTYMSLPVRPLSNRYNIVLTSKNIELPGATVCSSIESLMNMLDSSTEVFICGGASVYYQIIPYADKIYITHIFSEFEADTFFPELSDELEIIKTMCTRENIEHEYPHVFSIWSRKEES